MSEQYRKTLADEWNEVEALRILSSPLGGAARDLHDVIMDDKYGGMANAVCLDARGVERLLGEVVDGRAIDYAGLPDRLGVSACDDVAGRPFSVFPMALPPPWRTTLVEVGAPAGRRHAALVTAPDSQTFAVHAVARHAPVQDAFPLHGLGWTIASTLICSPGSNGELVGRVPATGWKGISPPDDTLAAAMLALSLVNTSPASFRVASESPPPSLSKRHAQRHGRPLSRYHVLQIRTMRKSGIGEWESISKFSADRALHLRRGHWKDYRSGQGLFGKIKGMWFWEASVAGDVEAGVVAKDYSVKPPKPEES